jgi:hypothetical protein
MEKSMTKRINEHETCDTRELLQLQNKMDNLLDAVRELIINQPDMNLLPTNLYDAYYKAGGDDLMMLKEQAE